MEKLTNIEQATVADIEADGFLDVVSVIHVLSYQMVENKVFSIYGKDLKDRLIKFFNHHIENKIPIVMHNGFTYDKAVVEKLLGIDLSKLILIDTLPLSWYLYPENNRHGLAEWGEYFGVPKPAVEDWSNQPIEVYVNRCTEDVKINTLLWKKILKDLKELYGEKDWTQAVDYLTFKMWCASLKEKSKWKLDVEGAKKLRVEFEKKIEESKVALQNVMPKVPVTKVRTKPKTCFLKKTGELNVAGLKWDVLTKEKGLPFDYDGEIEEIVSYNEPNAGSVSQMKDWLYSLGWSPTIQKFVRNKETGETKQIPQIKDKDTGELCKNIVLLSERVEELKVLVDLSILVHRLGIVKGFLENVDKDGFVMAQIQGLTNTLRWKHKVCVNLPSLRKPYGKEIRGLLLARDDTMELMGADMSSLEDRTKQHYMWKYDPDYVEQMMSPDFDPHCDIAMEAGIMTEKEVIAYKYMKSNDLKDCVLDGVSYNLKVLDMKRYAGKGTNYSSTYGAGAATIARTANVSESVGKKLHTAYWTRNWSLKAIAKACVSKVCLGVMWLWNPVAKMWYWLKKEKDKFSTLNQGTGTFCFDLWLRYVLEKREQLTADIHDEGVWEIKVGFRVQAEKLLKDAVAKVNQELKLNRDLDIGVQFGRSYADIH